MSAEKTEALVIRHVDFSETSKIVTLFTRDFGKISALAKGARRLRSPFEAALDLLSRCRIVFLRKSSTDLDLLTESQLISRFRPSGRSIASLYAGYYVAELLDALTEPDDPHPDLYLNSTQTLDRIAAGEDYQNPLLRFELVLLREIGQLPAFDACMACGVEAGGNLVFSYWVSQSGILCPNCRREEFTNLGLHGGSIQILQKLSSQDVAATDRLIISPAQLRELRAVATAAITHILGRRPKMLSYLSLPSS